MTNSYQHSTNLSDITYVIVMVRVISSLASQPPLTKKARVKVLHTSLGGEQEPLSKLSSDRGVARGSHTRNIFVGSVQSRGALCE